MLDTLRRPSDDSITLDAHDLYIRWCVTRGITRPNAVHFTEFFTQMRDAVRGAVPNAIVDLNLLTYGDEGGTGHFDVQVQGEFMDPLVEQMHGVASARPFSLLEYLERLHTKLEHACGDGLILEEPTDSEGTVVFTDLAHREVLEKKVEQTPYLHSVGRVVIAEKRVLTNAEEARRAGKANWWTVSLDSMRWSA